MNCARARILARGVSAEAVSVLTSCLISGDASSRSTRQSDVPLSHIAPSGKAIRRCTTGREERNDHLPGDSRPRWHLGLASNLLYIPNAPLPQAAPGIARFHFRVVVPRVFKLPSGRKRQGIMAFPDGNGFLETPGVLQNQRMPIYDVFVADDIPRIGRGDSQKLYPLIRDQRTGIPLQG